MNWLKTNRMSALVVGLAFLISIAAYLGLLTSDGAVKARERESRMQAAREGFVDEDVASLEVDFIVASEADLDRATADERKSYAALRDARRSASGSGPMSDSDESETGVPV